MFEWLWDELPTAIDDFSSLNGRIVGTVVKRPEVSTERGNAAPLSGPEDQDHKVLRYRVSSSTSAPASNPETPPSCRHPVCS